MNATYQQGNNLSLLSSLEDYFLPYLETSWSFWIVKKKFYCIIKNYVQALCLCFQILTLIKSSTYVYLFFTIFDNYNMATGEGHKLIEWKYKKIVNKKYFSFINIRTLSFNNIFFHKLDIQFCHHISSAKL